MEPGTRNLEQRFLELIAGQPKSVGGRVLRFFLRLASWGYGLGVVVRNRLFDLGLKRSHSSPVPVISVGNLTTGGTGKTPTVALLVDLLQELGHHPGIISRGYRELSEGGNDEARVLELLCPGVPHIQNRDRVAAAAEVAGDGKCDIVLADDAFQHRRLKRDVDIVLLDALNPWGHGALLPRGLLREPISGLQRVDLVVLTRADLVNQSTRDEVWRVVESRRPSTSRIELAFEPVQLVTADGQVTPLPGHSAGQQQRVASPAVSDPVAQADVLAFCGIGNPDGFRRTLDSAGLNVAELREFPDHHHYSDAELEELADAARDNGAEMLVTTLKDLVKIPRQSISSIPIYALDIRARILSGEEALKNALSPFTPPPPH